jgi:two-component system cell cycle sensor histidine kinase/response regulator CckA
MLPAPGTVAVDVLDSLLEGCQVIGFDYRYLLVNATVAQQAHTTPDALLGRTMTECFPGIDASPMYAELTRCMRDRAHHRMENEFAYPDGSMGWFELRFIPVPEGVCVLSVDITEQKRAQAALQRSEEQLRQAQKMEAIGRLAGGVAHDFNNMLSVILSYATLAIDEVRRAGDGSKNALLDDLREIELAGRRAAQLTKQLLAFSRQQVLQAQLLDLNAVVLDVTRMLERLLGEDIEYRTRLTDDPGLVLGDAGQIEQILLNLAVNARDAMPDGGRLTIETASVELDEAYARDHLGTNPGPHVMLAVSDSGAGMDRETQSKIFEPFFTTKAVGKGTGLGLATVFGIVQQSHGSIWVYSEPGKGTTFKVYFPVATSADAAGAVSGADRARAAKAPRSRRRGQETILVVEDDPALRKLTQELLERDGYRPIVAESPAEALAIVEQNGRQIDMLLTDVVMPGMNGREVSDRVRALRPEIRVVYMSGYTGDVVLSAGVLDEGAAFVQKPLTPESLGQAMERAFGPAEGTSG